MPLPCALIIPRVAFLECASRKLRSICEKGNYTSPLIPPHPMLTCFVALFTSLLSVFRSRASLELENLALRHQIGVLQRTAGKLSLTKMPSVSARRCFN
jgi:hypothetical protein